MKVEDEDPRQGVLFGKKEDFIIKKKKKKKRKEAKHFCSECGKPIYDEKSIEIGIGPTCLNRMYSDKQDKYSGNLFLFDEKNRRKLPIYKVDKLDNGITIIEELFNYEDVDIIDSIDEIIMIEGLEITSLMFVRRMDGEFLSYNGKWSYIKKEDR